MVHIESDGRLCLKKNKTLKLALNLFFLFDAILLGRHLVDRNYYLVDRNRTYPGHRDSATGGSFKQDTRQSGR